MGITGRFFAVPACIAAILSCAGCVVTRSEGDRMQEEIRAVKMELAKLRDAQEADRKEIELQVAKTQTKAADLEAALENVRKTYGSNVANFGLEQEKIIQKLMELNGKYDLGQHRADVLEADMKKIREEMSASKAKVSEPQKKAAEEPQGRLAEIKRPEKKKDYLNLGLKFLNDGQWEAARVIFREYLENFKGDPSCCRAQYHVGEAFYREGKVQNAVLELQKVITGFPDCDKVEDASYHLALSFAQIGLADDAAKLLQEFVKAYPSSKLAPKAKKKLDEMSKGRARR